MSYVYGLTDPRDDTIRYVGATTTSPERRLEWHVRNSLDRRPRRVSHSQTYKCHWIRYLLERELQPGVVVLEEVAEDQLYQREIEWIAFGRECGWPLTNATDGGEAPPVTYESCAECELVSNAGSLGRHQAATGHRGTLPAERPAIPWIHQRVMCVCGLELRRSSLPGHLNRCNGSSPTPGMVATSRRVRCPGCALETSAGPLARHRRAAGH